LLLLPRSTLLLLLLLLLLHSVLQLHDRMPEGAHMRVLASPSRELCKVEGQCIHEALVLCIAQS
jgi:hypothetical protein